MYQSTFAATVDTTGALWDALINAIQDGPLKLCKKQEDDVVHQVPFFAAYKMTFYT